MQPDLRPFTEEEGMAWVEYLWSNELDNDILKRYNPYRWCTTMDYIEPSEVLPSLVEFVIKYRLEKIARS